MAATRRADFGEEFEDIEVDFDSDEGLEFILRRELIEIACFYGFPKRCGTPYWLCRTSEGDTGTENCEGPVALDDRAGPSSRLR